MTEITDFVIGIFGRIISSVLATMIVRIADKFVNKN
nr:MAG TPA: hypothetical protein [Caudoviricetes sp.]